MSEGDLTIHVCTACRRARADLPEGYDQPGLALAEALAERLIAKGSAIPVLPVECLAVCKRPCTVAFAADGKWTYLIGDLETDTHLDEIVGSLFCCGFFVDILVLVFVLGHINPLCPIISKLLSPGGRTLRSASLAQFDRYIQSIGRPSRYP